jgi:hypothetical protein
VWGCIPVGLYIPDMLIALVTLYLLSDCVDLLISDEKVFEDEEQVSYIDLSLLV